MSSPCDPATLRAQGTRRLHDPMDLTRIDVARSIDLKGYGC